MRRIIPTNRLGGLAGLTAVAFLVLAPIYRFPAVPGQLIALIKLTLFFGAIALSSVVLWKRRDLAGVLKIVVSFATFLVAASIVGLVQSDISGISRHLQTIAWPALGLLIGFAVWQYFAAKGLRYYAIAMTAIAAAAWLCSALWYHDVGGLAYLRTGWSGSLGYAAIITLAMMGISPSVRTVALWAGCYFIIGASQVYYGGRAGLFFPIFAYLIVLMFGRLGPRIRNATLTITLFASILLTPYAFTLIGTALDKAAYVAQNVSLVPAPAFAGTPQLANTSPILESLRQKFRIARHSDERYINLYDRLMGGRLALMYEAVDLGSGPINRIHMVAAM